MRGWGVRYVGAADVLLDQWLAGLLERVEDQREGRGAGVEGEEALDEEEGVRAVVGGGGGGHGGGWAVGVGVVGFM